MALFDHVGGRVREVRKERGHTQEDLAKLVSLSRTSVTNIELGNQRLPLHQLLQIADALDCELHDFLPHRSDLRIGGVTSVFRHKVVGQMTPGAENLLSRIARAGVTNGNE